MATAKTKVFVRGDGVNVSITGLDAIDRKLTFTRRRLFYSRLLNEIGQFSMTKIKERTIQGKDVNNKPFKPYSKQYKMFREKKGLPTNKVDLTFTGSMLSSMTYAIEGTNVRIYFLNTVTNSFSDTRNSEKAFYLNEDREFFSLSKKDQTDISRIVSRHIRSELRKTK